MCYIQLGDDYDNGYRFIIIILRQNIHKYRYISFTYIEINKEFLTFRWCIIKNVCFHVHVRQKCEAYDLNRTFYFNLLNYVVSFSGW